jgi:hypothetical protein
LILRGSFPAIPRIARGARIWFGTFTLGNAPPVGFLMRPRPPSSESGMSAGRIFGFPLAIPVIRGFFKDTIIKEGCCNYIKMYAIDDTTKAIVMLIIHGIVVCHDPSTWRFLYISMSA